MPAKRIQILDGTDDYRMYLNILDIPVNRHINFVLDYKNKEEQNFTFKSIRSRI